MPGTISVQEFVQSVSDSGVLSGAELREALDGLGGESVVADAQTFASSLVHTGRLTSFQADAILAGRVPELCIGNYVVLNRLGAGGMGTVYKARHRRMHRVVAVKILTRDPGGQGSSAQRFQREVETIAQLNHPNIVMAFDAGDDANGLYLVMEYVDGRDLACEVARAGPLSLAGALDCVTQAGRGLAYAHEHGVVHRDVKPANLLRDSAGLVKVADLGLAQLNNAEASTVNASLTQAGSIIGTADYMAPEQALDSAAVDHRVDIYSLGCTLYFLLAGRAPYTAGSLMALLLKHRDAPAPSLVEARPDVPAELDQVYRRMVAKKPDERHPSMAAVVHALEKALIAASPTSAARSAVAIAPHRGASPSELTVEIDPAAPIGTGEFELTVSAFAAGDSPTPSALRQVADLAVVLVEPSRAQASIVRKYLQELGIENVRTTSSGRQALELAGQEATSVILSSMHLVDMTGVQLARSLHDDPRHAGVGFVLASSESDGGELGKSLEGPLTVVLPKPFDLQRLARALAQATGRRAEEILR